MKRYVVLAAGILSLAVAGGSGAAPPLASPYKGGSAYTKPGTPPYVPAPSTDLKQNIVKHSPARVVELTNQERQKAGARLLAISPMLTRVAQAHAENMARQGKRSHELDGKGPAQRLQEVGYAYRSYGENVADGYATVPEAMTGWMNSAGHKKNILNPSFTEIGVGIATDAKGKPYYCQVFATPR